MTFHPALCRPAAAILATAAMVIALLALGTTSAQALDSIYTKGGACQVVKKQTARKLKKRKRVVRSAKKQLKRAKTGKTVRVAKKKLKKAKRRVNAIKSKRRVACGPSLMRVSVSSSGKQANGHSSDPVISANDRYVAFMSEATNLVPGDTNGKVDIFVHDTVKRRTQRVSVSSSGKQGNGDSEYPSISADGRYIAFASFASTLVSGDTNQKADIFVHDRRTGKTKRVTTSASGGQANGSSYNASISANGRHVAYLSYASNVISSLPAAAGGAQGYVHDRLRGGNTLVTKDHQGEAADSGAHRLEISGNGQYVVFSTWATNFLAGRGGHPDTMIWTWDRSSNRSRIMSVTNTGAADPRSAAEVASITADGRHVAYGSRAMDRGFPEPDTVVRFDRSGGVGSYVEEFGDAGSGDGDLSPEGRFLAYNSGAGRSILLNTANGKKTLLEKPGRPAANGRIFKMDVASKGRAVAYDSSASNLVGRDTNEKVDVFVRRR